LEELPVPHAVDRVAVVSGGANGLGAAIVDRLRNDGVSVHVFDLLSLDAGSEHHVDVANEESCRRALATIGPVDILVNCAGVRGSHVPCWDIPDGDFERTTAVNLFGTYYLCRAVLPGMLKRGWGRVVNISSISGKDGGQGVSDNERSSPYASSKAGVIGLTKSLARECKDSVLVNCVTPGAFESPMMEKAGVDRNDRANRSPLRRIGRPEELAALVAWLCSNECSFSTGAVFDISGGRASY
jgi:NAD(P)-dependent dehydrogenase (short-subunit alcohol dehydrogenase family)